MVDAAFELPRGITGYGVDLPTAVVEGRRRAFIEWARAVAATYDSHCEELSLVEPRPSFDAVRLDRPGLWLLHNRYDPHVGALRVAPEPGPSWAVAGEFVTLDVPTHIAGWGPVVVSPSALNALLDDRSPSALATGAREQADRYKPETVGHVLFNYWS